jgi:putative membrane protein
MFWVHYGPGPGLFVLFGNLIWLLLLALLLGSLIRWLVGRNRTWGSYGPGVSFPPPPGPHPHQPPYQGLSALEILQQRYARGEIDAATFDQMRERLEASMRHDR